MHELTNVLDATSVRYWRMELMRLISIDAALHEEEEEEEEEEVEEEEKEKKKKRTSMTKNQIKSS